MKKQEATTREDLEKQLEEKVVALHEMRFGVAGSKSKNVKEYSNTKKEIAQIKTKLQSMK